MNDQSLVMLLAGGQGERLYPLTKRRAKPAVPFAGLYRIIDFTLSNCLNSGLKRIYVLTQHLSLSLDRHIRAAWSILNPELGEFIQTVPPQLQLGSRWYIGTADAVFQNLHLLEGERPERVLVLSGDHVYRMDYRALLEFHIANGAAATLAVTRVPRAEGTRLGVLAAEASGKVTAFAEKPADPPALADAPDQCLANMGVYVFETEPLVRAIIADAKRDSRHDFGHDILPAMLAQGRLFAYDVMARSPASHRYWQDVGTLDTYFEANMGLLQPDPAFRLFDPAWPIRTYSGQFPPALLRNVGEDEARVVDSLVSPGCMVAGGRVRRTVLSPGVRVGRGALIEDCILMPGVRVGREAHLRKVIVDENVSIPPGVSIGCGGDGNEHQFTVTPNGVIVVAEGTLLGG